jgi:shikimate kinase
MDFINQNVASIFINPPLNIIASRFNKQEKQIRPLFKNVLDDEFIQKLNDLLQARIQFYQQAKFTISKANATVTDLLQFLK